MQRTGIIKAKNLMVDDHFEVGGVLVRIKKNEKNDFNERVITGTVIGTARRRIVLIIPKAMLVNVYNQ